MKTHNLRTFCDVFKIIFNQCQLLGLVTFTRTQNGLTPSKLKYFGNVCRSLVFTTFALYYLYRFLIAPGISVLTKCTTTLGYCYALVYVNSAWLLSATTCHKLIQFIVKIEEFDAHFSSPKLTSHQNYRKKIQKFWLAKHLFLVIFFSVYNVGRDVTFLTLASSFLSSFFVIFNFVVCQLTTELVFVLHFRFVLLNSRLIKLGKQQSKKVVVIFGEICCWHQHLSNLVELFNDIFGVVLLFSFSYTFIVCTVLSFYIAIELQGSETNWLLVAYLVFVALLYVWDVVRICDACYRAVEEVSFCLLVVIIFLFRLRRQGI